MNVKRPPSDAVRLSADMVGASTGDIYVSWDERDSMLYALGVGAGLGAPDSDLQFTTENTEGVQLRAIPSFLTILLVPRLPPPIDAMDKTPFLHAEQQIEIARELPSSGEAVVRSSVEAVHDKGLDAIVVVLAELLDWRDRSLIGRSRASMYVRGGGGFGGERGELRAWRPPSGAPDARIVHSTRPEQALLFRLSGDRHPLHSDPAFARRQGFAAPILHGLATYGYSCRALVDSLCAGEPAQLHAMTGRFTRPILPGQTLLTEIWRSDDGSAAFRTLDEAGAIVIDRGEAKFSPP